MQDHTPDFWKGREIVFQIRQQRVEDWIAFFEQHSKTLHQLNVSTNLCF